MRCVCSTVTCILCIIMKTKTYGISFFSHIRVLLPGMNYLENSDNHTKDLSESLSNTLFLLFIVFPYFIFSAHINVLYVTSVIMHLCDMLFFCIMCYCIHLSQLLLHMLVLQCGCLPSATVYFRWFFWLCTNVFYSVKWLRALVVSLIIY